MHGTCTHISTKHRYLSCHSLALPVQTIGTMVYTSYTTFFHASLFLFFLVSFMGLFPCT